MSITFLFPNSGNQLSGGLKVVCEYANRLAADGHDVHIAYAGSIFWSKKTWFYKLTVIVRYLQTWCKGYSCRSWFAFDKRVKEHRCWSLNERHVCVPMVFDSYVSVHDIIVNEKNGYIIPAFDEQSYANTLDYLMTNKDFRLIMANKGEQTIRQYGSRVIALQWIQLFEKL